MKPWELPPGAYAGIGSRRADGYTLALMTAIARKLDGLGWTLRTGGADGADLAFLLGSTRRELFVPWEKFGGYVGVPGTPTARAREIAAMYHPVWPQLSPAAQKIHARNVHQALGADCATPSAFVLCWTADGVERGDDTTPETGGTAQCIRVASGWREHSGYGIPVHNLQRADRREQWEQFVNGRETT